MTISHPKTEVNSRNVVHIKYRIPQTFHDVQHKWNVVDVLYEFILLNSYIVKSVDLINFSLFQVYQVAYVIVKSAISPRPANWILERSVDGSTYRPWQYYAHSDDECWTRYGIEPTRGKPSYKTDSDVICTSYYSKLNPLEGGEVQCLTEFLSNTAVTAYLDCRLVFVMG
jgi:hypothetical protein